MSEHTKGRWVLVDQGMHIFGDEKYAVCSIRGYNTKEGRANARRIVATINACNGIDIEILESTTGLDELYGELQQQRDALLLALKDSIKMLPEIAYYRVLRGEDEYKILKLIAEIEQST